MRLIILLSLLLAACGPDTLSLCHSFCEADYARTKECNLTNKTEAYFITKCMNQNWFYEIKENQCSEGQKKVERISCTDLTQIHGDIRELLP